MSKELFKLRILIILLIVIGLLFLTPSLIYIFEFFEWSLTGNFNNVFGIPQYSNRQIGILLLGFIGLIFNGVAIMFSQLGSGASDD